MQQKQKVFLILGKMPEHESESVCGVYTSHALASADIVWKLKRDYPTGEFRIEERESE